MVDRLVRQDQGKIVIDGEDISLLPMRNRAQRGIGYLPQASIFAVWLSMKGDGGIGNSSKI